MPQIGPLEILIVAVIGLIVFGPDRLPEMARSLAKSLGDLRRQATEITSEFKAGLDEVDDDAPATAAPPEESSDEPPSA